MSTLTLVPDKQRRFSLSLRISIGLVISAIVPLIILFSFIYLQTRPALIDQANKAMASDAQSRVQLINTYFGERLLDAQTLTQVPTVESFFGVPEVLTSPIYQDARVHALYSLAAGQFRDKNYTTWTLFDTTGKPRLYYPDQPQLQAHGQSFVPANELKNVTAGNTFISPVYYSPGVNKATVDIYSPIFAPQSTTTQNQPKRIVGFIRATLNLDYIWNDIVQGDLGNNGQGSYAFILDDNGMRIADTNANRRFKSVQQLPDDVQQRIIQEERYGSKDNAALLSDTALATAVKHHNQSETFQAQIAGQNGQFQIVRHATKNSIVPWNYFVLSPDSTETALADQQLIGTILIASLASLLVAIVGLFVGRGISRPILNAVQYLQGNSQTLTDLATTQQDAASEQMWVVDSSQVGLQSVKYYTEATKIASRQLRETSSDLIQYWRQTEQYNIVLALEKIIQASQYIENASDYQEVSNQKLATALKVATQVTEQLHGGATSATEAAQQLEHVVKELRTVVGR